MDIPDRGLQLRRRDLSNEAHAGPTRRVSRLLAAYALGAAIVWAGLFLAIAFVLHGSPFFAQLLPILIGGMVWFVILVPAIANDIGRSPSGGAAHGRRRPST
jgi:Na+/proline symporter